MDETLKVPPAGISFFLCMERGLGVSLSADFLKSLAYIGGRFPKELPQQVGHNSERKNQDRKYDYPFGVVTPTEPLGWAASCSQSRRDRSCSCVPLFVETFESCPVTRKGLEIPGLLAVRSKEAQFLPPFSGPGSTGPGAEIGFGRSFGPANLDVKETCNRTLPTVEVPVLNCIPSLFRGFPPLVAQCRS